MSDPAADVSPSASTLSRTARKRLKPQGFDSSVSGRSGLIEGLLQYIDAP